MIAMAALAILALSAHAKAAGTTLSGGWMRALPAGLPAAGYFELHNGGGRTISLTGAASPACGMLMLHKSENAGGLGSMVDVSRVDVAPGGTVKFAPGGYHLMCMDPTAAIRPGANVAVTFHFADGSETTANFAVKNAQGK